MMGEKDNQKNPWFGPKLTGFGIAPRSWQGWLITLLGAASEVGTITLAHARHGSWFKAKTQGSGFTPATWQGWLVSVAPVALFLLLIVSIYYNQRDG